jgi:hypothetical protein
MLQYRVSFFKYLLSSDGHPAKALQRTIEVRSAKSADRAVRAAQHRYARECALPSWTLHADMVEVQIADLRPAGHIEARPL